MKNFSIEELEELNNFLSSPVGKKMMNVEFSLKISTITEGFVNDLGKTITRANKGKKV